MKFLLLAIPALFVFAGSATAEDKKPASPITLKIVPKTDKYKFDGGGKTADEYKKMLEETAKKLEKGEPAMPPKALTIDFVLQLTNTSKEAVTIYVGGDSNVYTFELTGGTGVVNMNNPVAFTADFRLPKAVTLEAGKSHEIPVKAFADGNRGFSRLVFWTGPGEYKLSAKYTLSDQEGGRGATLQSEPVKITIEK